ncbi:hypothetical protein SAMN05444143_1331 [Flavobacterium succinicans]|uniref:PD-(D/E)XK nuclease superfamily protein n=1 Tax=Flavobacterium succinicans TaxID=29536 RepID=A0A1I5ABF1_9FLAO|nr:PD-(D/E)XK nuclease domain-containing protein [Flavobacterium succinicans]SFN59736.1 hypothetical protein SAMN05444143_1331 [Flavobacterium succinicans]
MSLTNDEYEKEYDLTEIRLALSFYYNFLDQNNPFIFTENKFPVKRGEIISTLKHLENIPKKHQVNNLIQSHPFLNQAIESIENFKDVEKNEKTFKFSKYLIAIWLENLLFTGCNVLYYKFQMDFKNLIQDKNPKEILEILIKYKANLKNNSDSYSEKYLKLVNKYIEVEIEKNKALIELQPNEISEVANELIVKYLNQINNSIEKDDLYSSLKKKEYEIFIYKFKGLLYIPSYFDIRKDDRERQFHIFLLGVLKGKLENYNITSNKESGLGRFDICLNPIDKSDVGIIIEIKKVDEETNEKTIQLEIDLAIEQIENKNYYYELYQDNVKQIIAISLVFNGLEPNLKWLLKQNNNC